MKKLIVSCAVLCLAGVSVQAASIAVGTGANQAAVKIEFKDSAVYDFTVSFDGSKTGLGLLDVIEANTELVTVPMNFGWGVFIDGFSYQGHSNVGYGGGEDWWHYYIYNNSMNAWVAPPYGASTRTAYDGAADGWVYGRSWSAGTGLVDFTFADGQDVEIDLGFTVAANVAGTAVIIADPDDAANVVMQLKDDTVTSDPLQVSVSKNLTMAMAPELFVEFSYNFQTDGKLKVIVADQTLATIEAPDEGDPGRGSFALFREFFDLEALGLTAEVNSFTLELSNIGDPEVLLDDLVVVSTPEPATMFLLGLGASALLARRRQRCCPGSR